MVSDPRTAGVAVWPPPVGTTFYLRSARVQILSVVETVNSRVPPPKKAFGWFGWTTSRRKKGLTQRAGGRTEHVDVEAGGGRKSTTQD